ncbi:MAG TPA: sulfatase-like hydrolase/transferase, partial [Humisphaera sp.]
TKPGKVWDESSKTAHWRNRPDGRPFFAVFNHLGTHESQIRKRPHAAVHDPAKVKLPSYHPDTPEVRQDWAQYYDNITTMDGWFGQHLKDLADAGLADDTIVFFYGDHGSGMPRSKRSACNSGLDVALIVYVPEKWKHLAPPEYKPGAITDRLVSFVDLAPTLFSLAGAKVPEWVQGQAFMGPAATQPRQYVYGYRGRMDERMDRVRTVGDGRYVYVRNFMPHRPHGQYNDYMFQTPTTRVWKRLFDEGKLNAVQSLYWTAPKAPEELYDLQTDPDEVKNLAGSPEHATTLERMRNALRDWIKQTGDVGLMPEGIMHERAGDGAPYDLRKDPAKVPLDRIVDTAYLASGMEKGSTAKLADRLADPDAAVRYWAATGLLIRGADVAKPMAAKLRALLADPSPHVRIPAAETLGRYGATDDVAAAIDALVPLADVKKHGYYVATAALIALDEMGPAAAPAKDKLLALPKSDPSVPGTMKDHIPRLLDHIGSTLGFAVKE